MMYPYMTLYDETEIVHSQIIEDDDIQKVIVHFERPTEDSFDYARRDRLIYSRSNEDGEPIHVHISKGKPSPNSTKIWLTKKGDR